MVDGKLRVHLAADERLPDPRERDGARCVGSDAALLTVRVRRATEDASEIGVVAIVVRTREDGYEVRRRPGVALTGLGEYDAIGEPSTRLAALESHVSVAGEQKPDGRGRVEEFGAGARDLIWIFLESRHHVWLDEGTVFSIQLIR
jgi:hypothetical protein